MADKPASDANSWKKPVQKSENSGSGSFSSKPPQGRPTPPTTPKPPTERKK